MQNLANRVKHLRRALNMTQQQFSEEIGVTRGYVSQIESGVVDSVGARFLAKLSLLEARVGVSNLAAGPIKEDSIKYNVSSTPIPLRKIPVYTFVQAGLATDYEGMPTSWEDQIDYDGKDPKAFGLRVAGDSMEPKFPAGTIITVSPAYPPHNGQLVVAKIKNEGVLFKLFHHNGDGSLITLTSYNLIYPPLTIPREKLHWLYRVVRASQNL